MRKLLLVLLSFTSISCSFGLDTEEIPPSFFEALVSFKQELDEPLLRPFYGGISFDGKTPEVANLKIYIIDSVNVTKAQLALDAVFSTEVAENIELRAWPRFKEGRGGSKSCCWTDGVVSADDDERVGRVRLEVEKLDAINEIEAIMITKGIGRDAVIIEPGYRSEKR